MSGTITAGKILLTDNGNVQVITGVNGNNDAFDRLRVSDPTTTLFQIHHVFGKETLLIDEIVSGSGTSTHNSTNSYIQMSLANTGTGKVVRQSFEYVPYQPGKSRLMLFTGVLETSGGVTNSVSRIGCFDSTTEKTDVSGTGNGHFFELNGTTMYVVERNNNTDTKVAQSSWNVDILDGNGSSGLTVSDWSKAFIFAIDMEWLGVGVVRFGFFINGSFREIHRFNHSGIGTPSSSAIQYPYIKLAKLPVRYEIESSSAVNSEMIMICSTVISEGGFTPIGQLFSESSLSSVTINSTTIFKPIISIRLKETEPYNRATILLRNISILNSSGGGSNFIHYRIYILPNSDSLTDASWSDVNTSHAQIDTSATAVDISGLHSIISGYVEKGTHINFDFNIEERPRIDSSITGKSKILSIVAVKLGNNSTVYASLDWTEIK